MSEPQTPPRIGSEQFLRLVRQAESLKFYRRALQSLGEELTMSDEDLDEVLSQLVRDKHEVAFERIILAALSAGRKVDARHLEEGSALFTGPHTMANAALHCAGDVGNMLVRAVKRRFLGSEREAMALLTAAYWSRHRAKCALPDDLISEARLMARDPGHNFLVTGLLRALGNFIQDAGLNSVLADQGVPEHPPLEPALMQELMPGFEKSPLDAVPDAPQPVGISGFTVRRAVERVGRNEPCPCGSGKKYKRCCLEKDRERLMNSSDIPGVTQEELRHQPELGLSLQRLETMRSYEVSRIDANKVPAELREAFVDRLVVFGLYEQAVAALEQWPREAITEFAFAPLFYAVIEGGKRELLERLLKLRPEGFEKGGCDLGVDLLLAGDEGREQLDTVEAAALSALRSEDSTVPLLDFAQALLDTRPALGIMVARAVIPLAKPWAAQSLLEDLLRARDRLKLAPQDPICDIVDEMLSEDWDSTTEDTEELTQSRRELQAKAREMRKLQQELKQLHKELDKREAAAKPTRSPQSLPQPQPASPQRPSSSAPPASEADVPALRERIASLKELLKERHNERNALRRELHSAREQIENLRSEQGGENLRPKSEDSEERLLETEEIDGRQPIRLPDYPSGFNQLVANVPRPVARACLVAVGRLASGDQSAFIGVKKLKSLPDVYRQRISEDYRLLFRLLPGKLEVLDLVNRRDLERKIKSLL